MKKAAIRPAGAPVVAMFGTDFHTPGGITAVVRSYMEAGLFARWPVRFVATYRGSGMASKAWNALRAFIEFVWLLMREQVAVVHVHSASRGSFWRKSAFLMLGRMAGCKTIFHIHSGEFPVFYREESGRMARWYIRWILRNVDVVAVLTDGWIPVLREIEPAARLKVIYNPVLVRPLPSERREREQQSVLFLGRLREKKGVFDLIRAMGMIAAQHPRMRLVLAGDGDQSAIIEAAHAAGIADRVTLPGWVDGDEKQRLMDEAAVFVLPSYFEGLPVGVLEAMANGTPVVASRVGGIPDVVEDGVDGWLIEPGNVDQLARVVANVLDDTRSAAAVAKKAYAKAEKHFDANRIVAQLGGLYEALASEEGKQR